MVSSEICYEHRIRSLRWCLASRASSILATDTSVDASAMAPNYRAAIIGLGFVGCGDPISGERLGQDPRNLDGTHFSGYQNSARVDLVAGCDRDPGNRQRFASRSGARVYADAAEMLQAEQPEIVSVATYTPSHPELTELCFAHGVRVVYCEKPIAQTLAAAEAMRAAEQAAGGLLVINHNRRFHPNFHRLHELIRSGDLGNLTGITARWPTGRLGNVGTHFIDLMRMVTGREVLAVSGTVDLSEKRDCRGDAFHDPGGWGVLRFEGDLMATFHAANFALGPADVRFEGTAGWASTGGDTVDLHWLDGRHESWPSPRTDATSMDRAVAEIVRWLDGEGAFPVSSEDAVRTLEVLLGVHVSHDRQAAWTPLPLQGEGRQKVLNSG